MFVAVNGGDHRWAGVDETTRATISIYNLLIQAFASFGKSKPNLYPWPERQVSSDAHLFAPTIKDFNPNDFLRALGQA